MSDYNYKSSAPRLSFFKQMVILGAIGGVATITSQFILIGFLQVNFAAQFLSQTAFADYSMLEALTYAAVAIYLVGFFGVMISSLMLIYRLTANAHAMGYPTTDTPAWSVGWWFVPFANLFKPYQHLKDLLAQTSHVDARSTRLGRLLLIWWLAWVIYNVVSSVTDRILADPSTNSEIITLSAFSIIETTASIAILYGYFIVLRSLTRIQMTRSGVVEVF